MKKFVYIMLVSVFGVFISCTDKDDIEITRHYTLTYVINTQNMYDNLGITSEVSSNYLNKGYSIGVYTFIYDSNGDKIGSQSSTSTNLGTSTEEFVLEDGSYTVVTFETLVGSGVTPSWKGDDRLTTLVFEDKSSSDYHCISGKVQTSITVNGGNQTTSVSPEATRVLLNYNINTQSIYDEFGVATDITNNFLRDKAAAIGLFTYIYNSVGDLVDSIVTQQFTLNTASQIRSLAKGSYTIVTIETLVDTENNNQSGSWSIIETEKLATLKISQGNPYMRYPDVVGVCTTTTNINNNIALSAIPKAIGSFVRFHSYNFADSPFLRVGFGTSDLLDYYSINPQLSREDKFAKNLSQSDKFTLRGSISTEDISAGYFNEIYIVESNIIPNYAAQDEQLAGTSSWTIWEANNESLEDGMIYDAGFYYLYSDDEYYYARNYFGNATGLASWKAECDEYVKSLTNNTLYEEPYIKWDGSVASVKSYMSGYEVGNGGKLVEDNGYYVLWYNGKYKEAQIQYYFTSSTGGLFEAVVLFSAEEVGEDDLSKAFEKMGYIFILSEDGYSVYVTKDYSSFVQVTLYQNVWIVEYFSSSSDSARSRNMKKDFSSFIHKLRAKNLEKTCVVKKMRQCEKTMKFFLK